MTASGLPPQAGPLEPSGWVPRGASLGPSGTRSARAYEAYCWRQTQRLLTLVPREALRPLYREARRSLVETEVGTRDEKDPMALLHAYCRGLLPLPPFHIWQADVTANPSAHLDDATPDEPVPVSTASARTVETRSLDAGGSRWRVSLDVFRDGGVWRGSMVFRRPGDGELSHRTAEVFREDRAESLRDRFLELDAPTLEAFLRSVLP